MFDATSRIPQPSRGPLSSRTFQRERVEDLRDLIRHAPRVELGIFLGHAGVGVPEQLLHLDAPPCITRNERGWQLHRGGDGPLYEFASEREVAEFVGSRMIRPRRR